MVFTSTIVTLRGDDNHTDHHGCTGPLSTEPSTGVADEGGELLIEGEAGDQGQHLNVEDYHGLDLLASNDHKRSLPVRV